jgi:kynurenine formamidase
MPDAVLRALAGGVDVYDLGRALFVGMPKAELQPEFRMALQRRHGDIVRDDGTSSASELIVTAGHVGTHIDALCHIAVDGRLHGGVDAFAAQIGQRFSQLGIETVDPLVCRGLLLDIPAVLHRPSCTPTYEVTCRDLDAALELAGVRPEPGDVILIRTGWGRHFDDRARYEGLSTGTPGVAADGARWLAAWRPRAVGADTIAFERVPPAGDPPSMPAHPILIVGAGIHIIEVLDLEQLAAAAVREFAFVLSPLRIVGATGSPVRPIAIVASRAPLDANVRPGAPNRPPTPGARADASGAGGGTRQGS